ncbi:MAG: hypothetical protein JXB05_02535 [Myxococcaceae bacterium]|nr:hypothetical protein [Myxococcaceae bacterium]
MRLKRRGRMISATKVRSLLSTQDSRVDTDLQKRTPGQPLLLQDGQVVLVFEDGKGTLYPSREALIELLDHVEALAKQGPVDPKRSLLPPPATFLAEVQEQAARLAQLMGSQEALDGSAASLEAVDRAIHALSREQRLSSEWVSSLVAYVGEIMRTATDGHWAQASPSPAEDEPVVVTRDGKILQPFALVYGELRRGRHGSLQGAMNGALRAFRLGGAGPTNH